MSHCTAKDADEKLWTDILHAHWDFLDMEESLKKIELRKELEALLVKFLSSVPHRNKFLLQETVQVLQSSITNLADFSAYKASIGFESISQYANNLFTKPWRKEYKVIKMYSGFYQHEIKNNLIGAEKLFEAMGYRKMPNQTLVLDGAICPDQVTNASRDAMIAYSECQIMKDLYAKLTPVSSSPVTWADIYRFRESCNGADTDQSFKQRTINIHEKQQKHPAKILKDNGYNQVSPGNCNTCGIHPYNSNQPHQHQQHQQLPQIPHPPPPHAFALQQHLYNNSTCGYNNQQNMYNYSHHNDNYQKNLPPPQLLHQMQGPPMSSLTHSKSLDQYQDSGAMYNMNNNYMQRHSVDFNSSAYGQPPSAQYACVDSIDCNAFIPCNDLSYNISGSRAPLPFNISSNLGPYLNNGTPASFKQNDNQQCYAHHNNIHPNQYSFNQNFHQKAPNGGCYLQQPQYQQQPQQPEKTNNHQSRNLHHPHSEIYINHNFESSNPIGNGSILSKKKTSFVEDEDFAIMPKSHNHIDPTRNNELIFIDKREEGKKPAKKIEKYQKDSELLLNYQTEILPEVDEKHYSRNSRNSDFDSYEDEFKSNHLRNSRRIPNKNQDGIGSYESWNYVFKNLEKQGYNKDLGERGDVLANEIDENVDLTANTNDKGTMKRNKPIDKLKTLKSADKMDGIKPKLSSKYDNDSAQKIDPSNSRVAPKSQVQKVNKSTTIDNNNSTPIYNTTTNTKNTNSKNNNILSSALTNHSKKSANKENNVHGSSNGILVNHQKKKTTFDLSNQQSNSEWSCRFCTYLNSESRRICEMCSKSRDFNSESNNTATCV